MRALRGTFALLGLLAAVPAAGGDWRDLQRGVVVEIEGDWKPSRGFVADEIEIRSGSRDSDVEIVAPLEGVDPGGVAIHILGAELGLATDVRVRDTAGSEIPLASLVAGDWVEIDGRHGDGGIEVRRIRRLDGASGDIEIEGPVTSPSPGARRAEVAGIAVALGHDTEIRGGTESLVPRAIDDDDEARGLWTALDGRVRGGGRLQMKVEPEDNFDLNATRPGNLTESQWDGDLQLDARVSPGLDAFVKAGFAGTRVMVDEEGDEVDRFDWRLQQAYAVWFPAGGLALQIGRQDFDETREWLYDENLDGVRLHLRTGRLRTEASVSTRWNTRSSRLEDWTNWILYARTEVARDWEAGAYALHRRHSGQDGDRPTWLGLRSEGRLASGWRHWADFSLLRGTLGAVSRDAWAADVGLRWRLERRTRLSATAGWAVGSGGLEESAHFRQTGLHDNNDKLGGVTSFRYYGELLDPELTNLSIATGAVGIRPLGSTSVDLVLHDYRQRQAWPRLVGSNLDARPSGADPDIGREWDVIVAFERIPGVDLEYVFAVFQPGRAFDPSAAPARFHKLEIELKF